MGRPRPGTFSSPPPLPNHHTHTLKTKKRVLQTKDPTRVIGFHTSGSERLWGHAAPRDPPSPTTPPLTPCSFYPAVPVLPGEEHLQGAAALWVRRGCARMRGIPEDDSSVGRGPAAVFCSGLRLFVNAGESRQRPAECFPLLVRKILSAIFI